MEEKISVSFGLIVVNLFHIYSSCSPKYIFIFSSSCRFQCNLWSQVENDGLTDGQCGASGPAGRPMSDLILDPWFKLGHK